MLSCDVGDWWGDYDWYYCGHSDMIARYPERRKRCCSCRKLIQWGEESMEFFRFRAPNSDIEERIWGDEVELASKFTCEACSGLVLRLEELGYSYTIGDESLKFQIQEYLSESGLQTL